MADNASTVLLAIAETELAPIEDATLKLRAASDLLDKITDGVIASELVVAAAALVTAISAPGQELHLRPRAASSSSSCRS